jgi:hypothetical protein
MIIMYLRRREQMERQPWIFDTKKRAMSLIKYRKANNKDVGLLQKRYNPTTKKNYWQIDY